MKGKKRKETKETKQKKDGDKKEQLIAKSKPFFRPND